MPREFNRKNEISDVVKWEVDPIFCRDKMEVVNTGVTDLEFRVGEVYKSETLTKLSGSTAITPAAWTATLSDGWAAGDTLTIGTKTYTFKDDEADFSQGELLPSSAQQVVAKLATDTSLAVAGYTLAFGTNTIVFTQETASSTETSPTVSTTSTTATVTTVKTTAYSTAVTGNEADMDFIVLENKTVYAGQTLTVLGLCRGPAIVDINNVVCTDKDAMKAQLKKMNIITIAPSPKSVYQNT